MKISKRVAIVGAGRMGCGITELFVRNGFTALLTDLDATILQNGLQRIQTSLFRVQEMTEDEKSASLNRVVTTMDWSRLGEANMAIEAVPENEEIKRGIFQKCDQHLPPEAILASNTSAISITRLAQYTTRPAQVVGMHFMNPAPKMKIVELIRGMDTSERTYCHVKSLVESFGKLTCTAMDRPGFIVNRILMPMINEAFFALMEGVATAEDIDAGMKHGTNQPMGPLTLADFIGLDVCLAICTVLHQGLGDDKYRPCPLLRQYVDAGWYGRKAGRGVFHYPARN